MEWSNEDLDRLQEYAEALTPLDDIAVLMGISRAELVVAFNNPECRARRCYELARATAALKARRSALEAAEAGNPEAIKAVAQYLEAVENALD